MQPLWSAGGLTSGLEQSVSTFQIIGSVVTTGTEASVPVEKLFPLGWMRVKSTERIGAGDIDILRVIIAARLTGCRYKQV